LLIFKDDFRLFCGDLGNEVTDDLLKRTFNTYPSFARAQVVRDKKTGKSKGYGFVSFLNQEDYAKAFRDWNGKYVGNRPIKLKKSTWKDRALIQ
jgi:RNA recognition motif-containing protein